MRFRMRSSPDCTERWRCGISRSSSAISRISASSASIESMEESRSRFSSGTCLRICAASVPSVGLPRQIRAIGRQIHAGQHDFLEARFHQAARFGDDRAGADAARMSATVGNDAERAAVVATVLHLQHRPRAAVEAGVAEGVQQLPRRFLHRHDVVDHDARRILEEIRRIARGGQLFLVAEHAIDFGHRGVGLRLDLGRASGHDQWSRPDARASTCGSPGAIAAPLRPSPRRC